MLRHWGVLKEDWTSLWKRMTGGNRQRSPHRDCHENHIPFEKNDKIKIKIKIKIKKRLRFRCVGTVLWCTSQ